MSLDIKGVLVRGKDNYFHPENEEEVCALVDYARFNHYPIRVVGSSHSTKSTIHTDSWLAGKLDTIEIKLDCLNKIAFDEENCQITVQAGCIIGYRTNQSNEGPPPKDSLFWHLAQREWALPNIGGVSHQTIGGFISTGSEGASTSKGFGNQILKIRFLDGLGVVHEVSKEQDSEVFFAVGVSFGLLGILLSVTLQCIPAYNIIGSVEVNSIENQSITELEGIGPVNLLKDNEYCRLIWAPQANIARVQVWRAKHMLESDYTAITGGRYSFNKKPYRSIPRLLGSTRLTQFLFNKSLKIFDCWQKHVWIPGSAVIGKMVCPITKKPMAFWDTWQGIAMDDQMLDRLVPVEFLEVWIPFEQVEAALKKLEAHFKEKKWVATRNVFVELYSAPPSLFWLSPAYEREMIRINIFWFNQSKGSSQEYFSQFSAVFSEFDYRLHWGKYLFDSPEHHAKHLHATYPRLKDFLALRDRLDPQQIFLTAYWRDLLGVTTPPQGNHEEISLH